MDHAGRMGEGIVYYDGNRSDQASVWSEWREQNFCLLVDLRQGVAIYGLFDGWQEIFSGDTQRTA